jgi:hypothetical protein
MHKCLKMCGKRLCLATRTCVYYRVEEQQVIVLAVFHTARDSSLWQSRA